jgi:hypothetical protein
VGIDAEASGDLATVTSWRNAARATFGLKTGLCLPVHKEFPASLPAAWRASIYGGRMYLSQLPKFWGPPKPFDLTIGSDTTIGSQLQSWAVDFTRAPYVITVGRKLGGILPYRLIFFPTPAVVRELTARLQTNYLARLFWADVNQSTARCLLRHYVEATICIDLTDSLEAIWLGMDAKSSRYEIRKAEKLGSHIKIVRNGPQAKDFVPLFNSFALQKREVSPISDRIIRRYGRNIDIFMAYMDGEALCGHALLCDREIGRARLLLSGSKRLDDPKMGRLCGGVNRLLHWEEMRFYKNDGFRVYDMGGVIHSDLANGITRFKMSFGGELRIEHTYLCAGTPWLGRILQKIFETVTERGQRYRSLLATEDIRDPKIA